MSPDIKRVRRLCEAQQSYCQYPECDGCGFAPVAGSSPAGQTNDDDSDWWHREGSRKTLMNLSGSSPAGQVPPPMVPSAEERANTLIAHLNNSYHDTEIAIGQTIAEAYRDGYTAALDRLHNPSEEDVERVSRALGECICSQLRLEKTGEGDKQRVYFILPGKALDFSEGARAALRAAVDMVGREG